VTLNSGRTETCPYQHGIPGWQIIESQVKVLENIKGRGSYTKGIIAKDGQFTINVQQIGDKWKVATDLAIKAGDIEAKKKLDLEYQRHQQLIASYASNENTFWLTATANGGAFQKSRIHVVARVKLIRLQ
jgi:hypothetical protein